MLWWNITLNVIIFLMWALSLEGLCPSSAAHTHSFSDVYVCHLCYLHWMEGLVENKTSLPELVYSTSYAPLPNVAIWPRIPSNQRLHLMGKRHKRDAIGTYGYGESIDNWQAFVWCTGLPGVGAQTAVWWTDGCMTPTWANRRVSM